MSLLPGTLLSALAARLRPGGGPEEVEPVPMLTRRPRPEGTELLRIRCPDPTAEDALRDRHTGQAQFLARQERWADLSEMIADADRARETTPGGMPLAELFAYGARADVVAAAEHALLGGLPPKDAPIMAGIEALEEVLSEAPEDPMVAAVVAQAHMDMGWAWRGTAPATEVESYNREVFAAHFDRAADILSDFAPEESDSALLVATHCALLGGRGPGESPVEARYNRLIDLMPGNPRPYRALGVHLLPRFHGSYEALELAARRTALRSDAQWGAGGYTWVQFDAVACDEQALANLDIDFFIEGLHDILDRRPDPHTVNLLAAFCANAVARAAPDIPRAEENRARIADCATWIIRSHLTELHPMVWAHAARGFDNNLRVYSAEKFAASGRADAVRIITGLFEREIAAGKRIVFTDEGPRALSA